YRLQFCGDMAHPEFEATYQQLDQLGDGGCGCVYAGYRKADHLPVRVSHEGRRNELSAEVAIMLKLASKTRGSVEESAPVSLLDWYDLDQELILVLERPVPCKDLSHYIKANGDYFYHRCVFAKFKLHNKSVFHRDIKIENILIETGSSVPRVRLIDFGLGCFFKKRSFFRVFYGTVDHAPPEWMIRSTYSAGPTTVWQMGVVLFELLHRKTRFKTEMFLKKRLTITVNVAFLVLLSFSPECQDFLKMCLDRNPEQRPSLQQLRLHPCKKDFDSILFLFPTWKVEKFLQ
uniref:Serine/threonine-protein kinase n=1 Tax=Mola mola TaxID=94237 RepID=A0A3Q3WC08_MOLML